MHTTVINSGVQQNSPTHALWGCADWLQSWLMLQSPHRLRNDLKCVKWDIKPYYTTRDPRLYLAFTLWTAIVSFWDLVL